MKDIIYKLETVLIFATKISGGKTMKYTQEVKDRAVEAAKNGMSLKEIQSTIGPNPKAVMRYLVKEGIDYKQLKTELKEAGKLKESTNAQGKEKERRAKKAKAEPVEEVIEE